MVGLISIDTISLIGYIKNVCWQISCLEKRIYLSFKNAYCTIFDIKKRNNLFYISNRALLLLLKRNASSVNVIVECFNGF